MNILANVRSWFRRKSRPKPTTYARESDIPGDHAELLEHGIIQKWKTECRTKELWYKIDMPALHWFLGIQEGRTDEA